MQVSAVTFHYYARTVAFDNEYNYLITSTVVHLHSSLLSVPDCFCSLFLFPFNTCLLLNKHREVVYSLRLHSDCDRPAIIFHTTFLYLHIYWYSIHGTPCARCGIMMNHEMGSFIVNSVPSPSLESIFNSPACALIIS
jgi:hypothetical protein